MKRIFIGIIIGMLFMITTVANADSIKRFILTKVTYPLVVNGNIYSNAKLPVLNYNGNTYVPLKAIGDLIGASVKWNATKKQVEIGGNSVITPSKTSQIDNIKSTAKDIATLSEQQKWNVLYTYVDPVIQAKYTEQQFIDERKVNGAAFARVTNIEVGNPIMLPTWMDTIVTHKSYSNVAEVPVKLTVDGSIVTATMHLTEVNGKWKYFWSPTQINQSFAINQIISSGPMTMTIDKITFDPSYQSDQYSSKQHVIILHVKVQNTSDQTVNWYPDQSTIALNTQEQVDSDSIHSDSVGGEFIGKVIKTGNIVYPVKSDFSKITSFKLKIDGVSNSNLDNLSNSTLTNIIIKK